MSKYKAKRTRHLGEIKGIDEQAGVSDLPAVAGNVGLTARGLVTCSGDAGGGFTITVRRGGSPRARTGAQSRRSTRAERRSCPSSSIPRLGRSVRVKTARGRSPYAFLWRVFPSLASFKKGDR
jgi:hypothetical protein